jgi:hypothetical protein
METLDSTRIESRPMTNPPALGGCCTSEDASTASHVFSPNPRLCPNCAHIQPVDVGYSS